MHVLLVENGKSSLSWGDNDNYQFGDGSTDSNSPVEADVSSYRTDTNLFTKVVSGLDFHAG